jgi:purine-binding chemotaxis protein CheW
MENPIEENTLFHLVTFRLDRQRYALPIGSIKQVIEMVTITPVPQVQASVAGVINFHGAAIPVIDLRQHLGMQKMPLMLHTPILMVYLSERLMGLIVDEVLSVSELPSDHVIHPRDILPEGLGNPSLLLGLFYIESNPVILLDIKHLFKPQETAALADAVAVLPAMFEPAAEQTPKRPDLIRPKSKKKHATKKDLDPKDSPEVYAVETPG